MRNIIIILVLVLVLLLIFTKKQHINENFDQLSNEAVQNVTSVYANTQNTVAVNNIRATGTANLAGNVNVSGDLNVVGKTTLNGGVLKNTGFCDPAGRYCMFIDAVASGQGIKFYDTNSDGKGKWEHIPLNIDRPVINSPTINSPLISGGALWGSGLMDNSGRYGLFVDNVWNDKYGILMYDTNNDGKNTRVDMPTRIKEGQLGHANSFITALKYKTNQDATGNGHAGARSWFVGSNNTTDNEKPLCSAFFNDYCGDRTL